VVEAGVIVFLWRKLDATNQKIFGLLDKTNEILTVIQGRPGRPALPPGNGGTGS
jgi:hypothetical protein